MSPFPIRVAELDLFSRDLDLRLPFHFGAAKITSLRQFAVRAQVEPGDGRRVTGWAAEFAVPKWFEKDPEKSIEEDVAALRQSAERAVAAWRREGQQPGTVFDQWRRVYSSETRSGEQSLVSGYGVALVEKAVIDAACRAADVRFFDALRQDVLGFRPADFRPELAGHELVASLPPKPSRSIAIRHTIGMGDPLEGPEGPPESRWYKIKIGRGVDQDAERLLAIATLLMGRPGDFRFTLDGNEQYPDCGRVADLLDRLGRDSLGARLLDRLAFVEQPLPRARNFESEAHRDVGRVTQIAPLVIDEADVDPDAFARAHALGYRGVSLKSCKGTFRGLLNRLECERLGDGAFLSAEDLTTVPILALQADLATVAAHGIDHVERNGHHFLAGLSHLPEDLIEAALAAHPDLYRRAGASAELAICDGQLELESIQCVGHGWSSQLDVGIGFPI